MVSGEARKFVSLLVAAGLVVQLLPMLASSLAGRWHTPWWWGSAVIMLVLAATFLALSRRVEAAAWTLWFVNLTSSLTLGLVVDRNLDVTAWQGNLLFGAGVTASLVSPRLVVWVPALATTLAAQAWLREQHLFPYEPRRLVGDLLVCVAMALIGWVLWSGALAREHKVLSAQKRAREALTEARRLEASAQAAAEWDGFVHDEVLAVLTAVSNDSPNVRMDAGRVLEAFANAEMHGSPQIPLVEQLLDTTLRIHRETKTTFGVATDAVALPVRVEQALVEATAELLRNVRDHAWTDVPGASVLELNHDGQAVRVVVQDWGRGFDQARVHRGRLGLVTSVEGRMHAVGGVSRIESQPGHGTRVELIWPAGAS